MLKIVPTPQSNQSLVAILAQIYEFLVCAMNVAQQTVLLHSSSPGPILTLSTMHEIDNARALVEVALSKVHLRYWPDGSNSEVPWSGAGDWV